MRPAEKLAHSLGIALYIRDGWIYQTGRGEHVRPPKTARSSASDGAIPDRRRRTALMLFVDLDGVLADFDHREIVVGYRSDKLLDNAIWDAVATYKTTYLARSDAYISPGGPTCDDDYGAASISNSSSDCEVAAGERSCW
jgi:hypothetical protein